MNDRKSLPTDDHLHRVVGNDLQSADRHQSLSIRSRYPCAIDLARVILDHSRFDWMIDIGPDRIMSRSRVHHLTDKQRLAKLFDQLISIDLG